MRTLALTQHSLAQDNSEILLDRHVEGPLLQHITRNTNKDKQTL